MKMKSNGFGLVDGILSISLLAGVITYGIYFSSLRLGTVHSSNLIRSVNKEIERDIERLKLDLWSVFYNQNEGKYELTDFECRDGYIFEKCQCTGTWVGDDDFFFCQWESESEEDVLKALTSKGLDEFIFTALYPIDMQIDIRNLTGKVPYEPIFYLDDEYNPEKG